MKYVGPQEMKEFLERVDYRHPSFDMALFVHPDEGVCLAISFTVPDAYKYGEPQTQRVNVPVPPITSREHFYDWLKWRMKTVALHEVNEMFWVDGKPLLDPHSETYWNEGHYLL